MPLFDIASINLNLELKAELLYPSLTCWNRLEGSPRSQDLSRSLRAEVRDPLWMLTRQWQLGEFRFDNAGSPCVAKVQVQTTPIQAVKGRTGLAQPYDATIPLETLVERRPMQLTYPVRLQIGQYWLKLLRKRAADGLVGTDYSADYLKAYAFKKPKQALAPADVAGFSEAEGRAFLSTYAHQEAAQWAEALDGNQLDGGLLWSSLLGTGDPFELVTVAASDKAEIAKAGEELRAWFGRQYNQPLDVDDDNWSPEQLEYQFKCSLKQPDNKSITLIADNYGQGTLSWYSFDIDPDNEKIAPDAPVETEIKTETLSFMPTPVQFSGMPQARWWTFEDGVVNFANVNTQTTDLVTLLMTDFALMSSNDWFVIPYKLPVGSMAQIQGMVVTDVFGERLFINPAGRGLDDAWQQWRMFNLSTRGSRGEAASTALFVPPVVSKPLESKPIEKITFLKDEMANLAWGIESVLETLTGNARNGYELASEEQKLLERLYGLDTPESVDPDKLAELRYLLQTSTPANWIPFIPVQTSLSRRQIQFQRARLLRILEGADFIGTALETIRPNSETLAVGLVEGNSYMIFEEEIPRAGKIVQTSYQRCRDDAGRVSVWKGRQFTTGRGEGSSGLAFDTV
jgi:hypothetical protein